MDFIFLKTFKDFKDPWGPCEMLIPCDELNILNTFRVMINNDNFKTAVTFN